MSKLACIYQENSNFLPHDLNRSVLFSKNSYQKYYRFIFHVKNGVTGIRKMDSYDFKSVLKFLLRAIYMLVRDSIFAV